MLKSSSPEKNGTFSVDYTQSGKASVHQPTTTERPACALIEGINKVVSCV